MSEEVKEASRATREPYPASDLVWGGEDIGRAINRTARQAFHLLENGYLPAKKVGGLWCASRAALRRALTGEAA
jgi:hypothetical protein